MGKTCRRNRFEYQQQRDPNRGFLLLPLLHLIHFQFVCELLLLLKFLYVSFACVSLCKDLQSMERNKTAWVKVGHLEGILENKKTLI